MGVEPVTSWSPVRGASNLATEAGKETFLYIAVHKRGIQTNIFLFLPKKHMTTQGHF